MRNVEADILQLWAQPIKIEDIPELLSHLRKPLTQKEKIPVSNAAFKNMLATHKQLTPQDLATIWRISSNEQASQLECQTNVLVISSGPPPGHTEQSFIYFRDALISQTLVYVLGNVGDYTRNSNHNTSTGRQRPDYSFCIKGHCVFRGEEKAPYSTEDPRSELVKKLNWSYDPLPFILGEP